MKSKKVSLITEYVHRSFVGGIHPPENKLTADSQIVNMPPPKRVILPLTQHLGAPAKPVVCVGDVVKRGQKIAEASGNVSSAVHSSISGKVSAIIPWIHPTLLKPVESIVIDSDGLDTAVNTTANFSDHLRFSSAELRKVIFDSGIVGLGGACFPTHIKLNPSKDIDYLIINGCECEPYLTCDDALMRENAREIIEGIKIMMHILNAYQAVVAIEKNKKEAFEIFKKIVFNEPNIVVKLLPVKYPQGAEKQLIKVLTDREVPSGGLPFDVGVVVQNVATVYAVFNAVKNGVPLYERVVTITGEAIKKPGNYKVRLGTLISDVVEFCGGVSEEVVQVIVGGPMMGFAQASLEVPVIKGTSGILFMTSAGKSDFSSCIRCSKCVMVCPMNLMPNMLSVYAEKELYDRTNDYSPLDCIECGCCTYVCPASRPIVSHIKLSKAYLWSKKT